ncbi:MAG TPA: DUF4062 domain-containing protein [Longimicrobium sp.]|jgi:hypothetical protein|uniref:DUF4062 domain-containing protein n=1 Tax=Longimicrobium sp. TaxID=2029185 RepID=UPI002ED88046
MARPRVFVSSTYYDLRYVRSSLELFIGSLGFDAVLSETGGVAYAPDRALDESCYREVQNCDLYVLIVGGRYGSEISSSRTETTREFFDHYESVTRTEYRAALEKDIPVYILIERAVYAEYHTFQRNRDNGNIKYAHVDSINVFHFLDELLNQPRNNPVQSFDRYAEIEAWLREQWAGLFQELLYRMSGQQQLRSLAAQVSELSEVNKTLRRYLEEMLVRITPEQQGVAIVEDETKRLEEAQLEARLQATPFFEFTTRNGVPADSLREVVAEATSVEDVMHRLNELMAGIQLTRIPEGSIGHQNINEAREVLGLKALPYR